MSHCGCVSLLATLSWPRENPAVPQHRLLFPRTLRRLRLSTSFRPEGKQAEKGGAVETFPKHLLGHQVACAVCCTLPEIRPNCGPHGLTQDESNFVALGDPQLFPSQA